MDKWMMRDLHPAPRILMGPGPSNVHYRVYQAMMTPVIGYLDPQLLSCMDEISEMLRAVFQTKNALTLAISATGSSGMETSFVNFVEPGDIVAIGVNGFFAARMVEVATRCGAKVIRVEQEWGKAVEPERMIKVLKENPQAKLCGLVHGETSTGVREPIEEIGNYCKKGNTLLVVDAVTTLGGCPVKVDEWGIDVCYSSSQKCLSVPPGLSPITVSPKAMDILRSRKTKVQSFYFDLLLLEKYWGEERVYHHTAPASLFYALREGLKIVMEEGLEERFKRHQSLGDHLKMELEDLGFKLFAQEGYRLPMLTSVTLPNGVEDASVRRRLLEEYQIEIGGGLGPLKGKIWRIGLMGETCKKQNIASLIGALREILS
ncbi:MAG: pyridoxal-phosphate-dependent aminotransferase family protein [Thermodesulfobacteriota bacterium]